MDNSSSYQFKPLQFSPDDESYLLYRAGQEWSLIEPLIIEDENDVRSTREWITLLTPFKHQISNLITFCRRLPVSLIADDVGLGKTISAGLVMSELMTRGKIQKTLIVCPKILMGQWQTELKEKFSISSVQACGRELMDVTPPEEGGAIITTYQSARLHFPSIENTGFDLLVLDEAHKLRNLYSDSPPKVATQFKDALERRLFRYVLMLTATPIHNKLWDIYSLVDLLTIARGHDNPLGNQHDFTAQYIADGATNARQLNPLKKEEFRSIVYGYMSRYRRGDLDLVFPEREVCLHKVKPTQLETDLINIVSKNIHEMNPLAQISILQALVSSPHALAHQLENMAKRGTAPSDFAEEVRILVTQIQTTAKLEGLKFLVEKLEKENPKYWRLVIFTTRQQTQNAIARYFSNQQIRYGMINGSTGAYNQVTIKSFSQNPPDIHVIISTEAGAEGVNLQAGNVVINYDLPWNPMVVEQRIGRVQRLGSSHAKVCVYNIVLRGTFEENIIGRLLEKLQMASHAIGDIESLLKAAGVDDDEDEGNFEAQIRDLVVASLKGQNVEEVIQKKEENIQNARIELEREEETINECLGGMNGELYAGPRCPHLSPPAHSMDTKDFTLKALKKRGALISEQSPGFYLSELNGTQDLIYFDNNLKNGTGVLYQSGSSAFERLVTQMTEKGLHRVEDIDQNTISNSKKLIMGWLNTFGGTLEALKPTEVRRCFTGNALIRVRVTVAHDSYERLLESKFETNGCLPSSQNGVDPLKPTLSNGTEVGITYDEIMAKANEDPDIQEFCRFYQERLAYEMKSTKRDLRKRKKLQDDLTPKIQATVVGLSGTTHRKLRLNISYKLQGNEIFKSELTTIPSKNEISSQPDMVPCEQTSKSVPIDCIGECEITGKKVIRDLLFSSEKTGRKALSEHATTCEITKKRILKDEATTSDITGKVMDKTLIKVSSISGKKGEPEFFGKCEFTNIDLIKDELQTSQVSGKKYRKDQQCASAVSSKTGHMQEFIICPESKKYLLPTEADHCDVTGKAVLPGTLESCSISNVKCVPSEMDRCAVTGKKALKKYFVKSSFTNASILEKEAIRSVAGLFCAPLESKPCTWSGRQCHPDDLKPCYLTKLPFHMEYINPQNHTCFEYLSDQLKGIRRKSDLENLWEIIAKKLSTILNGKECKVETAELSPNKTHLSVCLEVRSWLGLKKRYAGGLYSLVDNNFIGNISIVKREKSNWELEESNG